MKETPGVINVMARIVARPEGAAAVEKALAQLVEHTRSEPGCLSYELYRCADTPGEFQTIEQWRDSAAADAHMSTPHVAAAIAQAGPLLASPPQINRYELVR